LQEKGQEVSESRSNKRSCLFNNMEDAAIIRHFQTKAKVEPVVRDVMTTPKWAMATATTRLIKPTSYKKVK
jgi:hypothetical protein